MNEHTPTPWEHHVDAFKVVHAPSHCIGDWTTVAICSTSEQASANADFIVRACNAHDDLVAAGEQSATQLEEAANLLEHAGLRSLAANIIRPQVERQRAALAKARGET